MNQQALFDYATAGGRVFASHFHYSWFNRGPFGAREPRDVDARHEPHRRHQRHHRDHAAAAAAVPQGRRAAAVARQRQCAHGGASCRSRRRVTTPTSAAANTASQSWIKADSKASPAGATEYFSFNTPTDAPCPRCHCGRVVFSDLHVGAASGDYGATHDRARPAAERAISRRRRRRSSSCSSTCRRASCRTTSRRRRRRAA